MNPPHEKENSVRLPAEKKGPGCAHAPTDWAECVKCVEDYYLGQLVTEQAAREAAEGTRINPARLSSRLFALVEITPDTFPPTSWHGRGKVFSVLKGAPAFKGASPEEALEHVLIAVLGELEMQKAALELRVALLETTAAQAEKAPRAAAGGAKPSSALAHSTCGCGRAEVEGPYGPECGRCRNRADQCSCVRRG